MRDRALERAGWTLFTISIAGAVVSLVLGIAGSGWAAQPTLPTTIAFAAVGIIIVSRRPRNVLGWLFLAQGLGAVGVACSAFATFASRDNPGSGAAAWAAWVFTISIEIGAAPWVLALLLFPHGKVSSPRWRRVVWAAILVDAVGAIVTAIADVNFHTNFPHLRDPVALVSASTADPVYAAYQTFSIVLLIVALIGMLQRFGRSRGDERQQIKWFVFATTVAIVGFALLAVTGSEPVAAFVVLFPLIPVAAGVAILKYRLYDIDLVITKAVVVGALAIFVTAVYVAIVVGIGAALDRPDHVDTTLSIVATAIVALAFQPVRERVQQFANRLVYGERATPYEVMAGFSKRVAGTLSVDQVLPAMAEAAARGVGASDASVRLFLPRGEAVTVSWPARTDESTGRAHVIPVTYQDEPIGEIAVRKLASDPITSAEDHLLRDLASQAGLAMHNVRLTEELEVRLGELARQSEQLQASRQRLVSARDAQRRGLERDIREGPQRQLLDIARALTDVDGLLASEPARAEGMVEELGTRANATLEGLRDLARGVFPPLLAEKGIVAALEAHVRKVGANAAIEASPGLLTLRFDADVEAAVYFCCLQAVQNVLRHAGNAATVVRLDEAGGGIAFEISDSGTGFDTATIPPGMGLSIMRDRIEALEGSLEVTSDPSGTRVRAEIPLQQLEEAR